MKFRTHLEEIDLTVSAIIAAWLHDYFNIDGQFLNVITWLSVRWILKLSNEHSPIMFNNILKSWWFDLVTYTFLLLPLGQRCVNAKAKVQRCNRLRFWYTRSKSQLRKCKRLRCNISFASTLSYVFISPLCKFFF